MFGSPTPRKASFRYQRHLAACVKCSNAAESRRWADLCGTGKQLLSNLGRRLKKAGGASRDSLGRPNLARVSVPPGVG